MSTVAAKNTSSPAAAASGVVDQSTLNVNSYRVVADPSAFDRNVTIGINQWEGKSYFRIEPRIGTPGHHVGKGKNTTPDFGIRLPSVDGVFIDIESAGSCGFQTVKEFESKQGGFVPLKQLKDTIEVHFLYYPPDIAAELQGQPVPGAQQQQPTRTLFDVNQQAQRQTVNALLIIEFLIRKKQLVKQFAINKAAAAAGTPPTTIIDISSYVDKALEFLLAVNKAGAPPTEDELLQRAAEEYYGSEKNENLLVRTQNKENTRAAQKESEYRKRYPLPTRTDVIKFTLRLVRAWQQGDEQWKTLDHDPEYPMMWTETCGRPRGKWALKIKQSKPAYFAPDKPVAKALSDIHAWSPTGITDARYIAEEAAALGWKRWHTSVVAADPDADPTRVVMVYLNREEIAAANAAAAANVVAVTGGNAPPARMLIPYGSFIAPYLTLQLNNKDGIRRNLTGSIVLSIEGTGGHRQDPKFDVTGTDVAEFVIQRKKRPAEDAAGTQDAASSSSSAPSGTGASTGSIAGDIDDPLIGLKRAKTDAPVPESSTAMST